MNPANASHVRGHDVAWHQHGDHGPRVLLIMGFGMSSDAWRPQIEDLSPTCQVVHYDNRGIHRSTPGNGPHDLPHLAADAAALLDHLRWPDAHIVGISMGGMIAQHLALGHRHRVRSLSLIATHAGGGLWHTRPSMRGLRLFLQANAQRGEQRLKSLTHLLFTERYQAELVGQGWSPAQLSTIATPSDPSVRLAHLRSLLTHDVRARLPLLRGLPTLVIKPDADRLVPPRCSDEIARLIPRARLLTVPSGHGVLVEARAAVSVALLQHIQAAD